MSEHRDYEHIIQLRIEDGSKSSGYRMKVCQNMEAMRISFS
jgi:hypothetical protein